MQDFGNAVAVVTGGASGIGLAMARRFAQDGAKIVIADIEPSALESALAHLRADGADAQAVACDVSKLESVQELLDRTLAAYGRVNILCNNAGVQLAGPTWQITPGQWEWILGVNLWGVIHGIHTFVPQMLSQGDACHIVNTSSSSGFISVPMMSAYQVTKHGVVTISESLAQELAQKQANIGVSVLCPGFVQSNLHNAERNRPSALRDTGEISPKLQASLDESVKQLVTNGVPAEVVAEAVVSAIRAGELHILTHPDLIEVFRSRADGIVAAMERQRS